MSEPACPWHSSSRRHHYDFWRVIVCFFSLGSRSIFFMLVSFREGVKWSVKLSLALLGRCGVGGLSDEYLWLPPGAGRTGGIPILQGAGGASRARARGAEGWAHPAFTGTIFFGTGLCDPFLSYSHCLPQDQ